MIAPSEESQDGHPADTSAGTSAGHPEGPRAGSAPAGGDGTDDPQVGTSAASAPAGGDGADGPQVEGNAAERVIFFSDAVVAIAITLLALGLPVPAGFDRMTNGQLLHALGNNWDEYFPFLISFVVIANHWAVHRKIFRPGAPETARHPDHAASLAVIIAFLVSIPVSFYTEWAFALWGTIPLLARVLRGLPGSGRWSTRSADRRPAARNGS